MESKTKMNARLCLRFVPYASRPLECRRISLRSFSFSSASRNLSASFFSAVSRFVRRSSSAATTHTVKPKMEMFISS